MTLRLVQKALFKGTQEFEIVEDAVHVRIKSPFKEKELSVVFSILNPEPVIEGGYLHFHSRVKCDPLLSLFRNKPNRAEFEAFVETIRRRALAYSVFLGPRSTPTAAVPGGNSLEEPPEFVDLTGPRSVASKPVNPTRVAEAIQMLRQYLDPQDIAPLLAALEALQAAPEDAAAFEVLVEAFNGLGLQQGAVLTYAPYISILLSEDPFNNG